MTSAQALSVERVDTSFSVVGDCPFLSPLIACFLRKNISYTTDHQAADYTLVWGGGEVNAFPGSRRIIIRPYTEVGLPTPAQGNDRTVYLGSLYGPDLAEPLLAKMVKEGIAAARITLPQDGVGKHYLLPLDLATTWLVEACVRPRVPATLYLLGYEFSMLSLAHFVRGVLPTACEVVFDETAITSFPAIPSTAGQSLEQLGLKLPSFEQATFVKYLSHLVSATSVSRPVLPSPVAPDSPKPLSRPTPNPPSSRLTKFNYASVKPRTPSPLHRLFQPAPKPPRPVEFEPIPRQLPRRRPQLKLPRLHLRLATPPVVARILAIFLITLGLYSLSILLAVLAFGLGLRSLSNSLRTGQGSSYGLANAAGTYLRANLSTWETLPIFASSARATSQLVDAGQQAFRLAPNVVELRTRATSLGQTILSSNPDLRSDPVADLNSARLLIESLYADLSLLQATLPSTPPAIFPGKLTPYYSRAITQLNQAKKDSLTAKALLSIFPDLVGIGGRRNYALLLQNNMELRPTGGFIGSFAILSFDNGNLFDLPVYDVYQADGQLKGHIEPPFAIRKYLGEANWFLRDSNWDPDFQTTSGRVVWYLKKTLNQDVDGVIGLNLNAVQNILAALGSLSIPEYDETITPANLYARTQTHAEAGFFPGSTQKKEFLSALASALVLRLHTATDAELLAVASAVEQSLNTQDITLSLSNENSQKLISYLGWGGELRSGACLEPNCTSSYLSVVDANVGVNKANFFVDRNVKLTISFDPSLNVLHDLLITTHNTATNNAWPAGPYKNYQRLYLPLGSELLSLTRDGIPIPFADIDQSQEHNKMIVGYLVTTPIGSQTELRATYRVPASTDLSTPALSFFWQKQPGTKPDPLEISIQSPSDFTPTTISEPGAVSGSQIIFPLVNTSDRRLFVRYTHD